MNTITLELKVPEPVYLALQSAGLSREDLGERAMRDLAMRLYSEGRLSLGKAADMAGVSLIHFWLLIVEHGGAIFNYTEEDYEADRATIRRFLAKEAGA
jgi:predicted HTH domain antitoxin